jgi:hypothetical protein
MRHVMLSLLTAALTLTLTASVAVAGEITGTGESLEIEDSTWGTGLHARSECAFSGLDEPDPVDNDVDDALFGRTQSWGQIPSAIRAGFPHPGVACNPVR